LVSAGGKLHGLGNFFASNFLAGV